MTGTARRCTGLVMTEVRLSSASDEGRAAYNGHVEVAKELIANGANVMAKVGEETWRGKGV